MTDFKVGTVYTHMFLMVQDATGANPHIAGKTGAAPVIRISKNGAASVATTNTFVEVDSANMPGVYSIQWALADVNTLGSFALYATGTGADPTNEFHRVVPQLFSDLSITNTGLANVTSNLKQNATFTALFFMTATGTNAPAPGLTVTGQRTFGAAGFSPISGTIAEVGGANNGGGWYVLSGAAADSNSPCVGFKMSASGANDSDFTLWMQP